MTTSPSSALGISAIAIHQPAWELDNGWFGDLMPRKFAHHTGIEARGISTEDEVMMGLQGEEGGRHEAGEGTEHRKVSAKRVVRGIHCA